jgi:hypothetical protein
VVLTGSRLLGEIIDIDIHLERSTFLPQDVHHYISSLSGKYLVNELPRHPAILYLAQDSNEYIVWIRLSTGSLCIDLTPPEHNRLALIYLADHCRPAGTSLCKPPVESEIMTSISLRDYHKICYWHLSQWDHWSVSRDGHGYGLGYKLADPHPHPKNPNPNPRVYGLHTGRRQSRAGGDPCPGTSRHVSTDMPVKLGSTCHLSGLQYESSLEVASADCKTLDIGWTTMDMIVENFWHPYVASQCVSSISDNGLWTTE